MVWYVDNSKAAGNGEAGSPFNTLAAANSAAGANSIIFLYQGNATYTGGVSMKSGEDLFGQPFGLTVDGFALVAAGGTTPTITASGVNNATVGGTDAVAISGAGGDGVHVSGGNGTLDFAGVSVTGSVLKTVDGLRQDRLHRAVKEHSEGLAEGTGRTTGGLRDVHEFELESAATFRLRTVDRQLEPDPCDITKIIGGQSLKRTVVCHGSMLCQIHDFATQPQRLQYRLTTETGQQREVVAPCGFSWSP